MVRIFHEGRWPKKKRAFIEGEWKSRAVARRWCRNHWAEYPANLVMLFEDGHTEVYSPLQY